MTPPAVAAVATCQVRARNLATMGSSGPPPAQGMMAAPDCLAAATALTAELRQVPAAATPPAFAWTGPNAEKIQSRRAKPRPIVQLMKAASAPVQHPTASRPPARNKSAATYRATSRPAGESFREPPTAQTS